MNKIHAPRSPAIAPLLGAAFFVMLAVMAIGDPETGLAKVILSWVIVVVCGFVVVLSAWNLVFPDALSVGPEGFTQHDAFGLKHLIPWSDVTGFYAVLDSDPRKSLVGWTYAEGRGPGGGGQVDALWGRWSYPAEKVVEFLQSGLEASRR